AGERHNLRAICGNEAPIVAAELYQHAGVADEFREVIADARGAARRRIGLVETENRYTSVQLPAYPLICETTGCTDIADSRTVVSEELTSSARLPNQPIPASIARNGTAGTRKRACAAGLAAHASIAKAAPNGIKMQATSIFEFQSVRNSPRATPAQTNKFSISCTRTRMAKTGEFIVRRILVVISNDGASPSGPPPFVPIISFNLLRSGTIATKMRPRTVTTSVANGCSAKVLKLCCIIARLNVNGIAEGSPCQPISCANSLDASSSERCVA